MSIIGPSPRFFTCVSLALAWVFASSLAEGQWQADSGQQRWLEDFHKNGGGGFEFEYDETGNRTVRRTVAELASEPLILSPAIRADSATSMAVSARIVTNGAETSVFVEWGETGGLGNTTASQVFPGTKKGENYTQNLAGLEPATQGV